MSKAQRKFDFSVHHPFKYINGKLMYSTMVCMDMTIFGRDFKIWNRKGAKKSKHWENHL